MTKLVFYIFAVFFLTNTMACLADDARVIYVDSLTGRELHFNLDKKTFLIGDVVARWSECRAPDICFDSGGTFFEFTLIDGLVKKEWNTAQYRYELVENINIYGFGHVWIISSEQQDMSMRFLWSSHYGLVGFGTLKSESAPESMYLLSNKRCGLLSVSDC